MYSDVSCENTVFWCILMYSEMYSCILWFAIGIHCALCILVYSVCILHVSYNLKQRMEYIRIHTEYTTIHVSTPSHMARPVRLWDTPGYNGIQQDTSARAYPHRLHTWDTWGIHAAMMYPIVAGEIHAGYI